MTDGGPLLRPAAPVPERVIETHAHFWDHAVSDVSWSWLEPSSPLGLHGVDAPRYLCSDFRAETDDINVTKVVHMQCADVNTAVNESRFIDGLGGRGEGPDAFIAGCRLADGSSARVIAEHAESALFRGVRDVSARDGSLLTDDVDGGIRALAKHGATCEVLISVPQFGHLISAARRHPDVTFVLGHAGRPLERSAAYLEEWRCGLQGLAAQPNILCKVSSVAYGQRSWSVASLRPWVRGCIDSFGPDRCMYGGNWPPDRLANTYREMAAACMRILDDLTAQEVDAVFAGTAERTHRL
jgi:predicted TIM-barrel fold metal-dependent hydrolase